ncbi:hypothetical protein FRC17_005879 [Serendipita sp. 399]|nr:hypothetical protein FRC17_005879 [Serendipita sp. 399]
MIVGVAIGLIAIFALVTIVLLAWRRSRRDGTGYIAAIITQFSSGAPIEPARPWLQLPDTTPIDEQNASPLVGSPQGTQNAPRKNTMASTPVSPMISSNSNGERSRPRKATLPSTGLPQQVRPTPRRNTLAGAPVPVVAIPTPNETTEPSSQEQYQPEQVQEQEQEQYGPESTAQFHPRSTEALIAAAAPRNMSREQINELAANLVSLIRGRDPRNEGTDYEDDESLQEPPPYQGSL